MTVSDESASGTPARPGAPGELELDSETMRELGYRVVDLLADRIAVLYKGKLVEEGTGEQVLGAPRHPYTQRLLASLPVPDPDEQARRRETWNQLRAEA